MKGQEFLYLVGCRSIVALDMKRLLSSGLKETLNPVGVGIKPDKAISYDAENLPMRVGFCVDGSKLFLVGGEWTKRCPRSRSLTRDESKGNKGLSSTVYVADLSQSLLKFSKLFEFEGPKFYPMVAKIKKRMYALTRCVEYDSIDRGQPYFEAYNFVSKSVTTLPPPPFFNPYSSFPSARVDHHAVADNTLFVQVEHPYRFYNFDSGTWMRDHPRGGLLEEVHRHIMCPAFCWGQFVSPYEDVLITWDFRVMKAMVFPPHGSDEDVPIIHKMNHVVGGDLAEICGSYPDDIEQTVLLSLGENKMCAIVLCPTEEQEEESYMVYINIFQVSKRPDFLSATCLHKGFYRLKDPACPVSPIYEIPKLIGAFWLRDGKCISSSYGSFHSQCVNWPF